MDYYLNMIESNEPQKTHLITAENNNGNIIGYLLYNKVVNSNRDVSIFSTIVSEEYRLQGVFSDMINILKNKYGSIALSCFLNLVNFYKKFGFEIDGQWETQVAMSYGPYTDGLICTIDDNDLKNLPTVTAAFRNIQKTSGSSWKQVVDKFKRDNIIEKENVRKFLENYKNRTK